MLYAEAGTITAAKRFSNLAEALDELLPVIANPRQFRAAVAIKAEMDELPPPAPKEPDATAPLWEKRLWLSRPSFYHFATLNLRQAADGLYGAGFDLCCGWGSVLNTGGKGFQTAALALASAFENLLDAMQTRRSPRLEVIDELRAMIAEVEGKRGLIAGFVH